MMAAAQDNPEARRRWTQDPECVRVKNVLGKELKLGPRDANPLDPLDDLFKSRPERECRDDDPRMRAWLRALDLRRRMYDAHLDWITTGRWPPALVEADKAKPSR